MKNFTPKYAYTQSISYEKQENVFINRMVIVAMVAIILVAIAVN